MKGFMLAWLAWQQTFFHCTTFWNSDVMSTNFVSTEKLNQQLFLLCCPLCCMKRGLFVCLFFLFFFSSFFFNQLFILSFFNQIWSLVLWTSCCRINWRQHTISFRNGFDRCTCFNERFCCFWNLYSKSSRNVWISLSTWHGIVCSLSLCFFFSFFPSQNPDELFEVMSQCLLSAVDRDALSGWGAEVIIMSVIFPQHHSPRYNLSLLFFFFFFLKVLLKVFTQENLKFVKIRFLLQSNEMTL